MKENFRRPVDVIQVSTTSERMSRHNSNRGTLVMDNVRDIAIFSTPEHPKMGYTTSNVKEIKEDGNIIVETRNNTYVYKRV